MLFVIGATLLVIGHRRNARKLMLAAAIALFLAGRCGQFITGFTEGLHQGIADQAR